jgi:hypothetical protein
MKGFEGRSELAARLHRLGRHLPVFEAPGLLTTYVRGERFGDGTQENAFEQAC